MEKQKILYQQARLHARGAAEMVLQMISASKGTLLSISDLLSLSLLIHLIFYSSICLFTGRLGPMVTGTLKLGISILNGGNVLVQQVKSLTGQIMLFCPTEDTELSKYL